MVDISGAQKKIEAIKKQAQSIPWYAIGDIILKEIDASFDKGGAYEKEGSFEGGTRRWVKRKKPVKNKILQKSLRMRRRIRRIAKANGVTIKSTMPYSAAQHYGYKKRNLDARPFIILHIKARKDSLKLIRAHLSDV